MKEIEISGGRILSGVIEPSGSKNAALPIIFSTIAAKGTSYIYNVPDIGDIRVALEIIESFGAQVKRVGDSLEINTENLEYRPAPRDLTSKIRASSYLIGASLARFGKFELSEFGGCNFCNRPIDMHLYVATSLGASLEGDELKAEKLRAARIVFNKKSVGATINALIMSLFAEGETELVGVAKEPHVKSLVEFLISAGAHITEQADKFIVRRSELHGGTSRVIPDMIEAGTYLLLGSLSGGKVTVKGAAELELDSFLYTLSEAGINVMSSGSDLTLSGEPEREIKVITAPHPGYPTDLQPVIAPLMARFFGGAITENVWQNRFSYLTELKKFGVISRIENGVAYIHQSVMKSAEGYAPDLRGGVALLMCALAAEGESKIENADVILRGYSLLERKLVSLGAKINIINAD